MKSRFFSTAIPALAALLASCATGLEPAPLVDPNDANAELRSTTQGGLFSRRVTRLFAVDGKRVLDRTRVFIEPGLHEVEFIPDTVSFDTVRTLRFEARAGHVYEVNSDVQWFADRPNFVTFWIIERDSGVIVAEGDDSRVQDFRRKWYIDSWKRDLGGKPTGDGFATFVDYNEDYITIAGAHDDPKSPYMWQGDYEYRDQAFPAGTWVAEIHRHCGKGCSFYGRIVAEFRAGESYSVETESESFWQIGPSGAWLVNAGRGERIGRFHTCRSRDGDNRPTFVDCEAAPSAIVEYAGVEPDDPRFWWGLTGKAD